MFKRKEKEPVKDLKQKDEEIFEVSRKKAKRKYRLQLLLLLLGILLAYIVLTILSANYTYKIDEKDLKIPVFLYHNIVEKPEDVEEDFMATAKEDFERQMNQLIKCKYHFITYEDLKEYKQGKKALYKNSAILTFDDGYKSVYKNAYPFLKEKNIPYTIFVITDKADGATNKRSFEYNEFFTWDEAKEMQDNSRCLIASHSTNHNDFAKMDAKEALDNVNKSYEDIEKHLGKQDLKVFAFPYGTYTDEQINELGKNSYIINLADNKINTSNRLNLFKVHREYLLSDSIAKILLKIQYRAIRYK